MLEINREKSLGQEYKLNFIDNFGIYLSNQRVLSEVRKLNKPVQCLEIGCGYEARSLTPVIPDIKNGGCYKFLY